MSGETRTLCTHPLIADPWEHKLKGRAKWINSLTGLGTSQLLPWQICLVFGFFCPHLSLWRFPPFCSFSPVVQAQAWEPGALWFSKIPQNSIESLIYSGQNRPAWSSCVTLGGTVLPLSCAWLGGLCCCQCSWLKMGCWDAAAFLSLCSTVGHLLKPMFCGSGEGQVRKARRHLCCWFLGNLIRGFCDCSVTSDLFSPHLLPVALYAAANLPLSYWECVTLSFGWANNTLRLWLQLPLWYC